MHSNIPFYKEHNIIIAQLLRFAKACTKWDDFKKPTQELTAKLIKQGFCRKELNKAIIKFTDRYQKLVAKYRHGETRHDKEKFQNQCFAGKPRACACKRYRHSL
jgi:hypothetical protein